MIEITSFEIPKRWDIVVALFPFTEISVRKPRPILVLSNQEFNKANNHIIAAMITTAVNSSWRDDQEIEDLSTTGLNRASIIRWKIFTLPNEIVNNTIGYLSEKDRGKITANIAGIFLG